MRAFLKNNRQAPRKVRLVARAVIGKNVDVAVSELSFMPNKASSVLKKLILSAVSNASQKDVAIKSSDLKVKNITVDKGATYVRYKARAFGRAAPIRRESSHIHVILEKDNADANAVKGKTTRKEKKEKKRVKEGTKTSRGEKDDTVKNVGEEADKKTNENRKEKGNNKEKVSDKKVTNNN